MDCRFDLIDPLALFQLARVLDYGAKKYGENNWRKIPLREHLNRVISHCEMVIAELDGVEIAEEDKDDHITHMLCRAMFATALYLTPKNNRFREPGAKTAFYWEGGRTEWTCYGCSSVFTASHRYYTNGRLVKLCVKCFEG